VNESVSPRNPGSGSPPKQVSAERNKAAPQKSGKELCCTVLVRPGLRPRIQTFQKFTSNLPVGDEAPGTG